MGDAQLIGQTRDRIDQEVELVTGAIRMVAGDAASRMTVGGLRYGEAVLGLVVDAARDSGVTVEPLWGADEVGCDIRISRAHV